MGFMSLDEVIKSQYDNLRQQLLNWEEAANEYRTVLQRQVVDYSEAVRKSARQKLVEAHEQFRCTRRTWNALLKQCPVAA
jgi:hypothetical protein